MIPIFQLIHVGVYWILDFVSPAEFYVYPYLLSKGLIPYQQITDHHFPGLFFLPVNFFTLGFVDPLSFKLLLLLTIILTSVLLAKLSRFKSINGASLSQVVFLYSLWQLFFSGSVFWIEAILPLFMLPGLILFEKKRFLLSGLFFALAILFKQTAVLPIIFLSLYLLKKPLQLVPFWLPTAILILLLGWYFYSLGALSDFVWWNFTFNLNHYPAAAYRPPAVSDWLKISLPVTLFLTSAWTVLKTKSEFGIKLAILIIILALPGFSRFGLEHFQSAVPFFCLLIVLAARRNTFVWVPILGLSLLWVGFFIFRSHPSSSLINFSKSDQLLYQKVSQLSESGKTVFALGTSPLVYSQASQVPPGRFFFFPLPWLFSLLESKQLEILKTSPPDFIIFNPQSRVDNLSIFTTAPRLVEYMQQNYQVQATVAGHLIYQHL